MQSPDASSSSISRSDAATAHDAGAVKLMRITLHKHGQRTDDLTDDQVAAAYAAHQEERAKSLQEQAARAHQRSVERANEAAAQARRETVARCRREIQRHGEDPSTLSDDRAVERARELRDAEIRQKEELRRRQLAEVLFRKAGCPEKHVAHLDALDPQNADWIRIRDQLAERAPGGYLIALLGRRGGGKTQLAVSVVHRACHRGLSSRYVKARDLFGLVRGTFNGGRDGEREEDVINALVSVRVLVIDELHQRGGTDFERDLLTNIIDRRYDCDRATILIANQSREDFAATIGDSIISRMHETGCAFECEWASYRKPGMWQQGAGR